MAVGADTASTLMSQPSCMCYSDGGGYSYRLCPRTENLTEACFQRMPLDFTGLSSLRWNGLNGKRIWFNGTTIAGDYTTPTNSQWRKTPIPVNDVSSFLGCRPVCIVSGAPHLLVPVYMLWVGPCKCCRRRTMALMAKLRIRAFQRCAKNAELRVPAGRIATAPVSVHRQCCYGVGMVKTLVPHAVS